MLQNKDQPAFNRNQLIHNLRLRHLAEIRVTLHDTNTL